MTCPIPHSRTYPLRKPPNHTLPIPRYTATLPPSTTHIHTLYLGLQTHPTTPSAPAAQQAHQQIQTWLDTTPGIIHESFTLLDAAGGEPAGEKVWVCYWLTSGTAAAEEVDIEGIWRALPPATRDGVGLWKESFTTPATRLETNYAGDDYLPGLARLPGVEVAEHDLATYWGAARDRIPESAEDLFTRGVDAGRGVQTHGEGEEEGGRGKVLRGTNARNVVHIRSGQWWACCTPPECAAYEEKLEPTLRAGLRYLNAHRAETGCMGIRYLRNGQNRGEGERRETCGAGFFHNLEDLERWSRSHSSHLKIWRGALAHYKAFPVERKLRTWHEVSVIEEGGARWEYVNCGVGTGVMGCVGLEGERLEE